MNLLIFLFVYQTGEIVKRNKSWTQPLKYILEIGDPKQLKKFLKHKLREVHFLKY